MSGSDDVSARHISSATAMTELFVSAFCWVSERYRAAHVISASLFSVEVRKTVELDHVAPRRSAAAICTCSVPTKARLDICFLPLAEWETRSRDGENRRGEPTHWEQNKT